jgi:hypothetical protein
MEIQHKVGTRAQSSAWQPLGKVVGRHHIIDEVLMLVYSRRSQLGQRSGSRHESVILEDGLHGARFSNFFEFENLKFQKGGNILGCR